jgi:ABC-type lipoprotein release transport system permease subunit
MLLLKIGFRNLLRNQRRTLLTMSAMILANALLIFTLAMNEGIIWDIINNSTEAVLGHITVARPGYLDQPSLNLALEERNEFRQKVLSHPGVKGLCGRVSGFALVSFGKDEQCRTLPTEILGVDPAEELGVSRIASAVVTGTFLAASATRGVVLGKGLAQNIGAVIGGELVIMGQAADGSMAADLFEVAGIFDTGDSLRDSALAIMGRATVQEFFCLPGKVHKWQVFLRYPLEAETTAQELQTLDPVTASVARFTPWQTLLPQIAEILTFVIAIQFIGMIIFYSAVFLVSSNTMYMAFLERTREFAIIRAIGLSPHRLSRLLLSEGLILSTLSAGFGTFFGIILSLYVQHYPIDLSPFLSQLRYCGSTVQPRIICLLTMGNMSLPFVSMILLGPLVTLAPVVRLRGMSPVEALRES